MKPEYPYMPEGRSLEYVPADHPYMLEAKKAREECAGDPLFPNGAILVRDGQVMVRAGNGYNQGSQTVHVCPRVVQECPSGTGYDLCPLHDHDGHAEAMLMKVATEQGINVHGADVYMYGHWWCCEPCWTKMIEVGVARVFVTDDAHERFSRDRVYAETFKSSLRSVYVSGALTNLPADKVQTHKAYYEGIARVCQSMGIQAYVPHLHTDPEQHPQVSVREVFDYDTEKIAAMDAIVADVTYPSLGTGGELMIAYHAKKPLVLLSERGVPVSRFALGNPAVVYHLEYEDYFEALRRLPNILRQL
ncbi:hypothetical protein KJ758_00995 [Patescibacteria group bacterium]|nr:hypothetical protein [Patescibacteria group bacterium]